MLPMLNITGPRHAEIPMSDVQTTHGQLEQGQKRLPLGLQPDGEFTKLGVFFAFVLSTITVATLFPLGIVGIVLSSMAQDRVTTASARARKLQAWSWGLFAIVPSLIVILLVLAGLEKIATG
jgi:hypothetical protein